MRSNGQRVFFYVQHLLGVGHLRRAAILCRAFSVAGYDVRLAMGGRPVDGLDAGGAEIFELPSLHIGSGGFHDLVDAAGRSVDDAWKTDRRDRLLDAFAAHEPDILITEAFPFGRRQMRFELMPLLNAARARAAAPKIICSVRDILKSDRKPGRAEESVELINEFYDHVLIHGDPSFAVLEETFPSAAHFSDKMAYTGIVAEPPMAVNQRSAGDAVLVSAGGGAVGEELFRTALAARERTRFADEPWRLLAGPNLSAAALNSLRSEAPQNVCVERYRSDFRRLLQQCSVSVSQAGYNTVADILRAGSRAVLVPFDADGEDEQPRRARKLADAGRVEAVASMDLRATVLAAAIDRAAEIDVAATNIDLDGALNTVAIVGRLMREQR